MIDSYGSKIQIHRIGPLKVGKISFCHKPLEQDDCISRTQAQTELEMNTCRYTLAKERGGTGKVEWDSCLIGIADAVNIIRNLPSAKPQEPVLDKIRDEIDTQDKWLAQVGYTAYNVDIAFNSIKRVIAEREG